MNEEQDIFKATSEDAHRGELMVSVFIIMISVSLVVGLFYVFSSNHKNVSAEYSSSTDSSFTVFDDENINLQLPESYYQQQKSNLSYNDFFTKNIVQSWEYKSTDENSSIIILKANDPTNISILDIFPNQLFSSEQYISSMLLSFSQIDQNKIIYEVMYSIDDKKIHSREQIMKTSSNNTNTIYLIAFQSSQSDWGNNQKVINDIFNNINIK